MYMSGTIRSWLHYVDLRAWHGTQWEHTQIALNCYGYSQTRSPYYCSRNVAGVIILKTDKSISHNEFYCSYS